MTHSLLAVRTDFSLGESILSPEEVVKAGEAMQAKAIALTDTMSITAMIDFTKRCDKAKIKPIIGCRLRIVDDPSWRKPKGEKAKAPAEYYPIWYCISEKGQLALFRLLTLANTEERFYNNAKLSFEDLFKELDRLSADDVAISTGDVYGLLHHPQAQKIVGTIYSQIGQGFFYNLIPINAPYWDTINGLAIKMRETVPGDFLVTRPVQYLQGGADAAEILQAIVRNRKVTDPWHSSPFSRDLHPFTFLELTRDVIGAVHRLLKRGFTQPQTGLAFKQGLVMGEVLVERVKYKWSKAEVSLPKMSEDEFGDVVRECVKGWKARFSTTAFGHQPGAAELVEVYKPRLAYELDVLKKLKFSGYFLLVQDVVNYAKTNGILVGPGRGSVGGSLVAYLMGITDCDPIRFGLLFERFINPDRIDLPDADLDFMSERRHEVVEYLVKKYGRNRVAGVSNFSTLGPPSALREVSRAFNMAEVEYRCSKLMPKVFGQSIELTKATERVAEIKTFSEKYPDLWKIMLRLEGVMRNMAQHAAGIVVGGCDLVERAVIERRAGEPVVCWDKRIVEDSGLVKMDILGLSTLDLIDLTLRYVRGLHAKKVNIGLIPLDDPKVLTKFALGLTTGIFQFESGGMRRLLKELGHDGSITFDDITAATALYRPGPMESGMMDSYFKRKQGLEDIEYDHPLMEPILKPTFGVMVYQEQVMQVARAIAGYSAPDADKLRKIMGKKLPEEMKKERGKFCDGCVATVGATAEWAGELFDKIEGFAGYGFNKSHSVEYTLISYQSMWLKTYFPVEFFAAALTLMKDDRLPALLKDAEHSGIEVKLPDVNLSTEKFEILTNTMLVIPFSRVKGLSENAAKVIVAARAAGPFKSMADFEARCRGRMVHKGKIEVLDKIGAFASIEPSQQPQRHPDRILAQREFIPGLITSQVPVHREFPNDKYTKAKIVQVMRDYRAKHGPEGDGDGWPVKISYGKHARFMVISDCPSHEEESLGMSFGRSFGAVSDAMSEVGLSRNDGYWTALIKRPKEGKQVSPKEIATYLPYLDQEIQILKPPVIVLLGSQTVRQFFPEFKGKAADAAGQVIYSPKYEANVVIGFNPGEIYHNPDKIVEMTTVFATVTSLLD